MKIKIFTLTILMAVPLSVSAQGTWKFLVKETFGAVPTGTYSRPGTPASATPSADIQSVVVPGGSITAVTTDYNPSTGDTCNDGSFAITTNPSLVGWFGGSYPPWVNSFKDNTGVGNPAGSQGRMLIINANPAKQGATNGTYIQYAQSGAVPGAVYRFTFFAANILRKDYNGKDGFVGLGIYDNAAGTGTPLNSVGINSWILPRTKTDELEWVPINKPFNLPLNYTGSTVYFNFYNTDTNNAGNGNDLALDDITIEMLVSTLSGKVFIDNNANGIQDPGIDAPVNGATYPLYAYCVDSNNNIVTKTQVKADGTYVLDTTTGVPFSSSNIGLKIIISSYNLNIGVNMPASYIYNRNTVSEDVTLSNHSDYLNPGTVNGIIAINRSDEDLTNVNFGIRPFCYKPASSGTALDTNHGITALNRAGANNGNWPMVRKGAWTALESKNKGFVINRVSTTAALSAIINPIEGMLVYDEEADCLKLYTIKDGQTVAAWHCLVEQTCPE